MIFNYYLSLGSNIEPKLQFLKNAVTELSKSGKILLKSSLYESDAWGNENQNKFLNAVIRFQTKLDPFNLLRLIKLIEMNLGRLENGVLWGPREIDIDIIFADGIMINKNSLKIPHEYFHKRKFVLVPMVELNKEYPVSGTNYSVNYFLDKCTDTSSVNKLLISW